MKLTGKQRNAMPAAKFGDPANRKFPMPDKSHAANAKARATQGVKKGTLTVEKKQRIDAIANKILRPS